MTASWAAIPPELKVRMALGDVDARREIGAAFGLSEASAIRSAQSYAQFLKELPDLLTALAAGQGATGSQSGQGASPAPTPLEQYNGSPLAGIPRFELPAFNTPLTIRANTAVVTSDWHAPFVHWRLWLASMYMAKAIEARHYFVIGDMLDNVQVSPWPKTWPNPVPGADDTFDQALVMTRKVRDFAGCNVYITQGNHDLWLDRPTGGQNWEMRHMRTEGIEVSRYPYCYLDTDNGRWKLTHPKNFSRVLLSVPAKHRDNGDYHVACAHTHAWGIGMRNGRYIAEIGGLFDPLRMQYLHEKDSTLQAPTPGFMVILEGDPYLINETTRLNLWLGDQLYREYEEHCEALEMNEPGVTVGPDKGGVM